MLKRVACLLPGIFFCCIISFSQPARPSQRSVAGEPFPATDVNIHEYLKIFGDSSKNAAYRITLCADVPNNEKPLQVFYQQETGHVFLILQRIEETNDTISRVFGFYPNGGMQTLFFKKTRSLIKDNSNREHDVAISKTLLAEQFDTVVAKSIELAGRKYHMNKYNCYDYAIEVFNSAASGSSLPLTHVRFPFLFGMGGSPCSVYKDLEKLKRSNQQWEASIVFGLMLAPISAYMYPEISQKGIANQRIMP
ncbi:MAG TPA: hypothetical protein VIZ28_04335 [Chitinophagaceae bacterium]